ncbi:MAG: CvpA family protein [Campylobacteraceae bacterium]|nr:CvpA family protein [Campylobacteraceae bacterium]
MTGINWLDIVVLVLVLVFALKGLASGLIREIFGIIGMVGGFVCAMRYKEEAGAWISSNVYDLQSIGLMSGNGTEIIVGFLATLFGIWFVALVLGELITKMLSLSGLGIIDRVGGLIFGGAKIFLILAIIAVFIRSSALLNKQAKPYFDNSVTFPYLVNTGAFLMDLELKDLTSAPESAGTKESNETNIIYEKSSFTNDQNAVKQIYGEMNATTQE